MIPISIQLYSLREQNAVDFPKVLRTLAETGYKGVEFAGFYDHKPADIARLLDDLGMKASSAHTPFPSSANIAEMIDTYKPFGVTKVISGLGPDGFCTPEAMAKSIDRFQEAVEVASANGFEFGVHNHDQEFLPLPDGTMPYDKLLAAVPALYSELDIFWAAFAKVDPIAVIKKYSSRLPLLHIKDGPLGPERMMSAVGAGEVDVEGAIQAADPSVTKWLIVEIDRCPGDMIDAVKESYAYLVRKGLGAGNKPV